MNNTEEITKLERELATVTAERDALKAWRASQMAVESEWNPNELAVILGATLGESQRKVIQREVPALLADRDRLAAACGQMREALELIIRINERIDATLPK